MKKNIKINAESFQTESMVISWMRLPLAMLVVFVHVPRTDGNLTEWICSDVIAGMAVPLFFVISGYLYFINLEENASPQEWYWRKTKSRLTSLGIPYIFWALLPVIVFSIRKIVGMVIHMHGPAMLIEGLSGMNFYHILWEKGNGGPENMLLWFIRNLLIISIFTPPPVLFFKISKIQQFTSSLISQHR